MAGSTIEGLPTWRPVRVDTPEQLDALLADPQIEVVDAIDLQLAELRRLIPPPGGELLDEPTRWFHYPWRRVVVHVLGPVAFERLRTDRNRNKITADEQHRLREFSVGVVGLSVGHSIAHGLAMERSCGSIKLADFDHIELSNLNRLPVTVMDLGVNKAVAAARRIAEIDPYIHVEVEPAGVGTDTIDDFVSGLDAVVEECDSFDVKIAVRQAARRARVPLVMETSDRGLLDIERYDLEPDRPIWHGLLGDVEPAEVAGLSTHDKVPYVLRTLEPDQLSAVMAASMAEIDETLTTWPQLAGDISLGTAAIAHAIRTIGLGRPLPSGRVRIDLEDALRHVASPPVSAEPSFADEPADDSPPADPIDSVVHAARLAPSGGNAQPWQFLVDRSRLEIWLEPTRTSALDLSFRGSYVAIGASLFNARVAAARAGVLKAVTIDPQPGPHDPVASVEFGTMGDDLGAHFPTMLARMTNRNLPDRRELPDDVVPSLTVAAHSEGAELHAVTDRTALRDLAEVLAESDRIRFLTKELHHDMMRELRWPGLDTLELGLDVRTLGLDEPDLAKLKVARRGDVMEVLAGHDLGRSLGDATRDRVRDSCAVLVVTVDRPEPDEYVRGGQAVERVWIAAQEAGLAVQPVSPVFIYAVDGAEYERLSPRFAAQLRRLHDEFVQITGIGRRSIALVMRIGYAPKIGVRSRRLPADRTVRTR